jgi:hypothetical protein
MRKLISAVMFTVALAYGACLNIALAGDSPAGKPAPAPAKQPSSIFDFGLEPLPNGEEEKGKGTPEKPEPAKPAPKKDSKPAPPPAKPPEESPVPQKPADQKPVIQKQPAANPPPHAVPAELQNVVDAVHIDAKGVITADKVVTLGLKGTEGEHFIAEGDFYPAAEPTPFTNGQVYFHLRHINGKKCIDLSINGMRAKRLLLGGETIKKFASPMKFDGVEREKWHHFKIEAGPDGLLVQFDDQKGEVKGPTETGGPNHIVLGPGAKLRNLKIAIIR